MRKENSPGTRKTSSMKEQIRRIEKKHAELATRIEELGKRAILTPAEQREYGELKKHKLAVKDEMTALKRAVA
ncbi:MAG: YdcH family protein [Polyangiaceae bacterium]|nr:YdcH family protein [Polyangiaceae bacterium]